MNYRALTLTLLLPFTAQLRANAPAIEYVSPSQFKDVPRVVIRALLARGCAIPQSGAEEPPGNVVSGHFLTNKRRDFAALCSIAGASKVLVLNGESGSVIAALNRQSDAMHLMAVDHRFLFMRSLATARSGHGAYCFETDKPCPCSGARFDGIVDVYEKWSETHCWDNGWHTVTSGD